MNGTSIDRGTGILRTDARPWGDAVWLAGHEIRRAWMSYIVSALYLGFFSSLMSMSDTYVVGTYSFEIGMIFVLILATPFFARDYMSWSKTPMTERLAWWRSMPIGAPTIVRARTMAILAALPLNAVAFFAPAWVSNRWNMPGSAFPWFCVALIGISIAAAGWTLVCELSVSNRRWITMNIVGILLYFVVLYMLGLGFDVFLFEKLAEAATSFGPVVAGAFMVAGILGLVACMRWAEDRLRRRDLAP